jgi:hypothetical protein
VSTDNLALWNSVEATDPRTTKNFSRAGGFKGTAISPMSLIKRATEKWGPMGERWGFRVLSERVVEGAPILRGDVVIGRESVHVLHGQLWYTASGTASKECVVESFGQTTFVGTYKDGRCFTDEEAPKKSLTDALSKALSWLGFAADVHMGRFDDVKYVNDLRAEYEAKDRKSNGSDKQDAALREKYSAILEEAAREGPEELAAAWGLIPGDKRRLVMDVKDRLKEALAKE